jgi:hypothetical protein
MAVFSMVEEKAELRSGVTAPFNKRLNEALQFNPQMPFNIGNTVTPSQLIGVLKGEQGTPGLPAAVSVVKDNTNLIMLASTNIERGDLKIYTMNTTYSAAGGETNNIDFVVPQNKKWIIKEFQSSVGTFVGTLSQSALKILIASDSVNFATGTTSAGISYIFPQQITLSTGQKLRFTGVTSAWTSGQQLFTILVQEMEV